mmetsp:Transcript_113327/g.353297  ORF Transcript_113327/g.353297 Transcript_113327/m.353297 type:complete len:254 (-) Transcript_113327:237-998(-)
MDMGIGSGRLAASAHHLEVLPSRPTGPWSCNSRSTVRLVLVTLGRPRNLLHAAACRLAAAAALRLPWPAAGAERRPSRARAAGRWGLRLAAPPLRVLLIAGERLAPPAVPRPWRAAQVIRWLVQEKLPQEGHQHPGDLPALRLHPPAAQAHSGGRAPVGRLRRPGEPVERRVAGVRRNEQAARARWPARRPGRTAVMPRATSRAAVQQPHRDEAVRGVGGPDEGPGPRSGLRHRSRTAALPGRTAVLAPGGGA